MQQSQKQVSLDWYMSQYLNSLKLAGQAKLEGNYQLQNFYENEASNWFKQKNKLEEM